MITEQAERLALAVHAVLHDSFHVQDSLGDPPRLYDAAPEDPVYPYLTYGAMRSEDIGADATPLAVHQMTFHVWSLYTGRAEILTALARIGRALTVEALSATEHISVRSANPIYSDILQTANGLVRHGLLRVSFTTEGAEL